nr:nose resistant to fluoxetine protein 6-like [Dermacentor andersoni]
MTFRLTKAFAKSLVKKFKATGDLQGRFDLYALPDKIRGRDYAFLLGICGPSTCSQGELGELIHAVSSTYGCNTTVKGCRIRTTTIVSTFQAVSMSVLGFIVLLVVAGTSADFLVHRTRGSDEANKYGLPMEMLLAFSARKNAKRLMSAHCRAANKPLQFINGMKTLMCLWVILGHTYIIMQTEYYHSLRRYLEIMDQLHFQIVLGTTLSVSTFFFMSGFLLTFVMQDKRSIASRQNPFMVYVMAIFRRYVRLIFPALAVLLASTLIPLMLEGPADDGMLMDQIKVCDKSWWALPLLVNNFKRIEETCLIHLWYISVDMQVIVVVALPLTIIMIYRPRVTFLLGVILSIVTCILTGYLTYIWDLVFSLTPGTSDIGKVLDTAEYIHFKPFAHVPSYMSGMFCGYLTVRYRNAKISKLTQGCAWFASVVLSAVVIYVPMPWHRGHMPTRMVTALYAGLNRIVWSLPFWWLHYACVTGRGGSLNALLSSRIFQVLGRLVYGTYLIHFPLLLVRIGIIKTPLQAEEFFQTLEFIGITVLSMTLAVLLNITCESPIDTLDRMLFRSVDKRIIKELNNSGEASKKPPLPEIVENKHEKSRL